MTRVLIIGGSDAGISAALRARELDPGCEVTMVLADAFPNFSICGLPFFLSGETPRWEDLAHRTRGEIESHGVRLLLDTRYRLHRIGDALAVHEHLTARDPGSAAIIGGGYIGLEMADALSRRGLAVTLLEAGPGLLQTVDAAFGSIVETELRCHGVAVRTSSPVSVIERGARGLRLQVAGDECVEADLDLVVTGVRPRTELAAACGVTTTGRGALQVNRRMETNLPDVFAAGDCVVTHHRLMNEPTYLPLGTTAHKQGRVAGENAVGGDAEFQGSLGTQVVKVFDLVIGRTGLRDDEARRAGFSPWTCETVAPDHKRRSSSRPGTRSDTDSGRSPTGCA